MARKKEEIPTIDAEVTEEVTTNIEIEKESVDTNSEEDTTTSVEIENSNNEEDTTTSVEIENSNNDEIPFNVKRILKLFKNYPELYVSNTGGVFTSDTKHSLRGNAILYKNPYYNYKSK